MELGSPALRARWVFGHREDGISKLPDEVLTLIFSFLPRKEVGRTSILSKRWRFAWMYHPTLEFSDQFIRKYSHDDAYRKLAYLKHSIDRALFCHGGSALGKCSFHCETNQISLFLYGWISAALCSKVQELWIKSPFHIQALPPSVFTCKTLVVLEIEGSFLMNLPFYVRFPCLKTLSLKAVAYGDDSAMQRLFSSCPVLEDLEIIRRHGWDGVLTTSINVPTLKRISIFQRYLDRIKGYEYKMEINAPNLEYLDLNDGVSKVIDVNFSDTLVEADIGGRYGPDILHGISHVEELLLSGDTFVRLRNATLPVFHNLIHLELGVGEGWNFLSNLLSSTPNLETLVFGKWFQQFLLVSTRVSPHLPPTPSKGN